MKSNLLVPMLSFCITASSCTKNEEVTQSKTDYLTKATWKLVKTEYAADNDPYYIDPDDCIKDDSITFYANHTYLLTRGTVKCFSSENDETASWSLSTDELTLTVGGRTEAIERLDNDSLIIVDNHINNSGVIEKTRETLVH